MVGCQADGDTAVTRTVMGTEMKQLRALQNPKQLDKHSLKSILSSAPMRSVSKTSDPSLPYYANTKIESSW